MKKFWVVSLALAAATSFAIEPPSERTAAQANNQFGLGLFKTVTKRNDKGNKFLSPVSAYLALSMAYNGASGETLNQMEATLGLARLDRDEVNQANQLLIRSLNSRGSEFQLSVANSLWSRKGFDLKQSFVDRVGPVYGARLATLDFNLPSASKEINQWVSDQTKGRIPTIVPAQLPRELQLLLVNATYFKAEWTRKFSANATRLAPFSVPTGRGARVVKVPTMSTTSHFRHLVSEGTEVIDLPYGQGSVSMTVLLPAKDVTLAALESSLTRESWARLVADLDRATTQYGTITMPKLELTYQEMLNGALQSLGMKRAFTDAAQFDGITGTRVSISSVLQKTFLAVDEKGTEAAAVTGISVGTTSVPPKPVFHMVVDRPYAFAIRDHKSGAILFLGSITEPEGGKLPAPRD